MTTEQFQVGERVRILEATPTTQPGDQAVITKIIHDEDGSIKCLILLVDGNPAKTHGTSLLPQQVERITGATTGTASS